MTFHLKVTEILHVARDFCLNFLKFTCHCERSFGTGQCWLSLLSSSGRSGHPRDPVSARHFTVLMDHAGNQQKPLWNKQVALI